LQRGWGKRENEGNGRLCSLTAKKKRKKRSRGRGWGINNTLPFYCEKKGETKLGV